LHGFGVRCFAILLAAAGATTVAAAVVCGILAKGTSQPLYPVSGAYRDDYKNNDKFHKIFLNIKTYFGLKTKKA
jgi:hypothetical protein